MKSFEWAHDARTFHGIKTDVKAPKFGLIVMHGMGEHIGRYQPLFMALEAAGILALGIDFRGHGKSLTHKAIGLLTPTDTFALMMDDIHALLSETRQSMPSVQWTLMGHSMGSLIARRYAQQYPHDFDQMIWMGTLPMYGWGMRKAMRALAWTASHFYRAYSRNEFLSTVMNTPLKKSVKAFKTSHDWLSVNAENVAMFQRDPLCGYAYNSRFYRQFFRLLDATTQRKNIEKTAVKRIVLMTGKEDPVTQKGHAHKQIQAVYQKRDKSCEMVDVQWEGMRHEPLNETASAQVFNRVIQEVKHA